MAFIGDLVFGGAYSVRRLVSFWPALLVEQHFDESVESVLQYMIWNSALRSLSSRKNSHAVMDG